MTNYYELLGISPDIETDQIKPYVKQKLHKIEKDKKLSKDEKTKRKNAVKSALKVLGKYKSRKEYDAKLENSSQSSFSRDLSMTDFFPMDMKDIIPKDMSGSVPFHTSQMQMMMHNMDGEQTVYSLQRSGDEKNQKEIYDKYVRDKNGNKKKQPMTEKEMENLRNMQMPKNIMKLIQGNPFESLFEPKRRQLTDVPSIMDKSSESYKY